MKEKIFNYGTQFDVTVIESSKLLIAVHEESINEGFLLVGHGVKDLPKVGDKGKIVFERDNHRGHWQWYPS